MVVSLLLLANPFNILWIICVGVFDCISFDVNDFGVF